MGFHMDISGWRLNSNSFVELLGQLVNEGEHLQNWPSGGYIPEEDRAADHILKRLAPFCGEGGPLAVEHVHLNPVKHPRRGNIIIRYPAQAPADSPLSPLWVRTWMWSSPIPNTGSVTHSLSPVMEISYLDEARQIVWAIVRY